MSQCSIHVFLAVRRVSHQPSWATLVDVLSTQTALHLEKLWFLLSLWINTSPKSPFSIYSCSHEASWIMLHGISVLWRNTSHWTEMICPFSRHTLIPSYIPQIPLKIILHPALFCVFGSTECCLLNMPLWETIAFVLAILFSQILLNLQSSPCGMTSWINKKAGFSPLFCKRGKKCTSLCGMRNSISTQQQPPLWKKNKILQAFHILAQAEDLLQSKNAQNVLELSPLLIFNIH